MARYGKTTGLKTLDALHLGAYSHLQDKGWVFVCADKSLVAAARHIGYEVIDPTADDENHRG